VPVNHPVGDHRIDDLVETLHGCDPRGRWVRAGQAARRPGIRSVPVAGESVSREIAEGH